MKVLLTLLLLQHEHNAAPGTTTSLLDVSQSRTASGTAWIPDAALVPGYHAMAGDWKLMLHGSAVLQFVRVTGTRAVSQVGSTNWVMLMATRSGAANALRARAMLTAEPYTLSGAGYPQLLQVAHPYRGTPAPDRQHPHELFAELSLAWEHALTSGVAFSIYGAPVGEPAIGPVAYNHRPSAAYEPSAPLGHIAQDYTHESLGVVTLGVFGRRARLEGSVFNGSHPDERHANFDLQGGKLDSYAGRLTVAAAARTTASAWFAYNAPETAAGHAHGSLHRFGAAVLHSHARPSAEGEWSTTLVYAATLPQGASEPLHTVLLESRFDVSHHHAVFSRVEYVRRTADELALTGSVPPEMTVGAASLGYAWRTTVPRRFTLAAGARITVNVVPAPLRPFYGSANPLGLLAYLRLSPP